MKDLDDKTVVDDGKASASRQLFERAVLGLDPAAANRLRLARRAAQAQAGSGSRRAWAPALASAALLVLGLAWWLPQRTPAPGTPPTPNVAEAPAPAPSDAAELATDGEDADLYAWLGEAPVAADEAAEQRL